METIKGFYLYYEDHSCFYCGESWKNVIGWYKGEPNREVLLKLAKKLAHRHLLDLSEEDLNDTSKVVVTDESITINASSKIHYYTETFELKDIEE